MVDLSLLTAGCSSNTDCPATTQCLNGNCVDPCKGPNVCGMRSQCIVEKNQVQCRCPPGYTGDPFQRCDVSSCRSDVECPRNFICYERQCRDPCLYTRCGANAECKTQNRAGVCTCLPGYSGNPLTQCILTVIGCKKDSECAKGMSCINAECRDPCDDSNNPCGYNSDCRVVDSLPFKSVKCDCKDGYVGNSDLICVPSEFN